MKWGRVWGSALAGLVLAGAGGAVAARDVSEFPLSQRDHWAWKRPQRPVVPKVRYTAWVRNPVDAFILKGLEAKGLKPAPTATREELIRRLAFGLTGLPPTPEDTAAFVADTSPNAYEKLVDRYLASPAYGERWARHWLDLARYADTNGYEHDEVRPDAWRYRDYVVRAFNEDKPYDRFVTEQLAGDEAFPEDSSARVATGFNLLGPDMTDAADQVARRQNTLNDMTDTAGLVFLGMTLACARCHDHKYEAIPQTDYYRLQAFFAGVRFRSDVPVGTPEEVARHARETAAHAAKLAALRARMSGVAGAVRDGLRTQRIAKLPEEVQTAFALPEAQRTADQQNLVNRHEAAVEPAPKEVLEWLPAEDRAPYNALVAELRAVEAAKPTLPTAIGLARAPGAPPKTFLLERGELSHRGAEVTAGFPAVLPARPVVAAGVGPRTVLARWITDPANPLTGRVMVNRVWQHHFGRGIVPSTSDFGARGEYPTHPELLDWLSTEFSKTWSIKRLHRLILTSNAYKQSSRPSAAALKADPENRLFSRMNRQRLEAEAVRDAVLAVSGRLNPKMGGPGVFPPLPEDVRPGPNAWPVSSKPEDHTRRSLYIFVRRNLQFPALEAFDSPDTNLSCPEREVTTTAPQALALLNSPDMRESARHLAGRVMAGAKVEADQVTLAYRLVLGRAPTAAERGIAAEFLRSQAELLRTRPQDQLSLPKPAPAGAEPWQAAAFTDLCLALLNVNEFVYVD